MPQRSSVPRFAHVGFKVLVCPADVRAAASPSFGSLIVTHERFDHRADNARKGGTKQPAYARRELQRPHVRGPLPVFVLKDPDKNVNGRPKDFLNVGVGRMRRMKCLPKKARNESATVV